MKKRLSAAVLFALLLTACFSLRAFAVMEQGTGEGFYAVDEANVLSEETEEGIAFANGRLEELTGAQIVVVAVEYLDGYYADEYAWKVFNDWGVGDDAKDNGMLLLFATEEGKGWLVQGAGISGDFTDDTAASYLDDYFWDDFDRADYDGAVQTLFDQLVFWYEGYYGVTVLEAGGGEAPGAVTSAPAPTPYETPGFSIWQFSFLFVVPFFVALVIFFSILGRSRRRYRYDDYDYGPRYPRYPIFWGSFRPRRPRRPPGAFDGPDNLGGKPPEPPRERSTRRPPSSGGFGGFGGGGRSSFGGFGGGFGGGRGFGGGGRSSGGGAGRR